MPCSLPIIEVLSRNFPSITDQYKKFALEKDKCRACELYALYNQVSQSEGQTQSPIFMILGESPGQQEVDQNRPFIGQAGQHLRNELRKYPDIFNQKTTLITNIVACRPENNKFPSEELALGCKNLWFDREIRLVQPKILIGLGSQPLKYIRGENRITVMRGTWKFVDELNMWTFVTYHPSYVIRSIRMGNTQVEQEFEKDIKEIVEKWQEKINK